jgi:hypothetical protein
MAEHPDASLAAAEGARRALLAGAWRVPEFPEPQHAEPVDGRGPGESDAPAAEPKA